MELKTQAEQPTLEQFIEMEFSNAMRIYGYTRERAIEHVIDWKREIGFVFSGDFKSDDEFERVFNDTIERLRKQ